MNPSFLRWFHHNGLISALVRKSFLPWGSPRWLFSIRPWNDQGSIWRPRPDTIRGSLAIAWQRCRRCPSILYPLSTPTVEGVGKVSRRAATMATFWLALAKAWHCTYPPPLAVDHHGTLCLKRKFAIVKFSQLGLNRYSLAGKFALSLRGPALSVDL
jgi:hypothetical protein